MGCARIVIGFTSTYAISAITADVVSSNLDQGEVYNIIWSNMSVIATGRWFYPGPSVSSINKTDRHDIAEILLKHHQANNQTNHQDSMSTSLYSYYLGMHA